MNVRSFFGGGLRVENEEEKGRFNDVDDNYGDIDYSICHCIMGNEVV